MLKKLETNSRTIQEQFKISLTKISLKKKMLHCCKKVTMHSLGGKDWKTL